MPTWSRTQQTRTGNYYSNNPVTRRTLEGGRSPSSVNYLQCKSKKIPHLSTCQLAWCASDTSYTGKHEHPWAEGVRSPNKNPDVQGLIDVQGANRLMLGACQSNLSVTARRLLLFPALC